MDGYSLSPHLVVGPPMQVAQRSVVYLKNRSTGRFFRLSTLEKSVLDGIGRGESDLALTATASAHAGRSVPHAATIRLLASLHARGILTAPTDPPVASEEPPAAAASLRGIRVKSPFEIYISFGVPTRIVEQACRLLRPIGDATMLGLAGCCLLLVAYAVTTHAGEAWHGLVREAIGRFNGASVLFLGLVILVSALHELSHSIACRRGGGQPGEIGLMFRYGMFSFFCGIDDLVVIESRRKRLMTILAGPMTHAMVAAPVAAFCLFSHASAAVLGFCMAFVAVNLILVIVNLLPILQMDGYLLFSIGWKFPELRQDSRQALLRCLHRLRIAPGAGKQDTGRTGSIQPALALYGAASTLCSALAVTVILAGWLGLMYHSPMIYGAPVLATAGSLAVEFIRGWWVRRTAS